MKLGSLFDGISGFPLAASWAWIETKWISEIDPFCLKVSKKNFPNAIQYGDIKEIGKGRLYEPEAVDIISGGFPCQPFSIAGNRKGKDDDRFLWPEMFRVVCEVEPTWVIGENVYGIINQGGGVVFEQVCTDLESLGYEVQPFIIPACGVDAPHKRDRVWIIANSCGARLPFGKDGRGEEKQEQPQFGIDGFSQKRLTTNSNSDERRKGRMHKERQQKTERYIGAFPSFDRRDWQEFPTKSGVCRRDDGIPNRVDRIKSLGNAIVPQVAYEIFKSITLLNR